LIELEILDLAFEGKGIAKLKTENSEKYFTVFVEGALPEDKVTAQITKKKSNYAEARVVEIISPSKLRVKPSCKFFGVCGGCKQQSLNYKSQLFYKQKQVVETLQKIGGAKDFSVEEIAGSENIYFYRNKLEFSFSDKRWLTKEEILSDKITSEIFVLGFHIPKIYDKILDIDECWLQSELSNKILNFTRTFFIKKNLSAYSTKTHSGFLRNLVIRQSGKTKDLMVNIVTSEENQKVIGEFASGLKENFPEVTTVVNNISKKLSQVAYGDYEVVYYGSGFIYDFIGEYKFRVSANSFFQTNTVQAENLYNCIVDFAEFKKDDIVYDLFSGAGTISLFVSGLVKNVFAFESAETSIEDAKVNTELNSVVNVYHFNSDLNKSILGFISAKNLPKPDIIITDPPRNGMHQNTVDDILSLLPEKIIYVSCNPATQARDIKLLCENKYELIKIKPFDMFPHTFHIENVALLKRK
jgi:23S rRNA (uracil1939-C5)-methyltransferase